MFLCINDICKGVRISNICQIPGSDTVITAATGREDLNGATIPFLAYLLLLRFLATAEQQIKQNKMENTITQTPAVDTPLQSQVSQSVT